MKQVDQPKGFTLIELLIVVAIIAVLAAIAVPNYMESRTRARVCRAKADMRSLAIAIEMYALDQESYPVPSDEDGLALLQSGGTDSDANNWLALRLPATLTTPVAYVTSLLPDPFPAPMESQDDYYHYTSRKFVQSVQGDVESLVDYVVKLYNPYDPGVKFLLLSKGPDQDLDCSDPNLYDPTNGTLSGGDIVYFGSGVGFRN